MNADAKQPSVAGETQRLRSVPLRRWPLVLLDEFRRSRASHTTLAVVLARIVPQGLAFLLLPFYSRMLETDDYGRIAVFMTWTSLFLCVAALSLHGVVSRAWFEFEGVELRRFISSISFLACILVGGVGLMLSAAPNLVIVTVTGLDKTLIMTALLCGLMMFAIETRLSLWVVQYNYKKYFLYATVLSVLQAVLSVILLLLLRDNAFLARWAGIVGPLVLIGGITLATLLAQSTTWVDREHWRYALVYCVPLVPHVVASQVMLQFDRVMLASMINLHEAGIYSIGTQIGDIAMVLGAATNTAWVPWFYGRMNSRSHDVIRAASTRYIALVTALMAGLISIAPILAMLLSPVQYWGAAAVSPIIMLNGYLFVLYSLYANVEFYLKRTLWISIGTCAAASANVALNFMLIPIFGHLGAAWTTVAGGAMLFLVHAIVVTRVLRLPGMFRISPMIVMALGVTGWAIGVSMAVRYWVLIE